jgi:hypothetical protein
LMEVEWWRRMGVPVGLGGPVPVGSAVQGAACIGLQCKGGIYHCR